MIFWILLFILVVLISFLLAYFSMRNFPQLPALKESDYGLFLIRKTPKLTPQTLLDFHQMMKFRNFIISFERLFKGTQSTLVIFAPRNLIQNYQDQLDLVELEDYTTDTTYEPYTFQMGVKQKGLKGDKLPFFSEFPILKEDELVFWQLILKAKKDSGFEILPRVAFFTKDKIRLMEITKSFQNLSGFLHKLPMPFSSEQMFKFYKARSFVKSEHNLNLSAAEVLNFILLKHS